MDQTTREVARYDPPTPVVRSVGRERRWVAPASDCVIDSSRGFLSQRAVERRSNRPARIVTIQEPLSHKGDTVLTSARQWCAVMCGNWGDLRIWVEDGKWRGAYDPTWWQ